MYNQENGFYVAHGTNGPITICPKMANRHGLIAGATGTGKTISLQVLAETFSEAGIPCFMADMKGDLSGISQSGKLSGFIQKRCTEFGITEPTFEGCPVTFYDVFGEQGHPMRSTISNMGPQLLARLMNLNETQTGVLEIVFRVADDQHLLLIDIKDLRAMLSYVADNAPEITKNYGAVSKVSISAIQRAILTLESQGAQDFFAEPSFDINDLMCTEKGKGMLSILAADKLMQNPKLYSTFLLWLLSDIYSQLPEVGDLEHPKLVFFFDEAHTLFEDSSKALIDKIEQVIRLIRSKGVGIYFITQKPTDIPEVILGQLGNRIQHALRAFTPKDQKAVKAAADTFRTNPAFKTENAIMELATGEALVSFLDESGTPSIVERVRMLFPLSQIGAITTTQRIAIMSTSSIGTKYNKIFDRQSAFEDLQEQQEEEREDKTSTKETIPTKTSAKKSIFSKVLKAVVTSLTALLGTIIADQISGTKRKTSVGEQITKRAVSTATRTASRELTRSILGNLIK